MQSWRSQSNVWSVTKVSPSKIQRSHRKGKAAKLTEEQPGRWEENEDNVVSGKPKQKKGDSGNGQICQMLLRGQDENMKVISWFDNMKVNSDLNKNFIWGTVDMESRLEWFDK